MGLLLGLDASPFSAEDGMARLWGEDWGDDYPHRDVPEASHFQVGLLLNFHNWPIKAGGLKRLVNTRP